MIASLGFGCARVGKYLGKNSGLYSYLIFNKNKTKVAVRQRGQQAKVARVRTKVSLLLLRKRGHSLPIITVYYHSLPFITIHYHSLPFITNHYHDNGTAQARDCESEGLRKRGSAQARECASEGLRKRGTVQARECETEGVLAAPQQPSERVLATCCCRCCCSSC